MASRMAFNQGLAVSLDSNPLEHSITIAIRFSGHRVYTVDASVRQTIKDVKMLVAERAGIPYQSLQLVLAGQQLEDENELQDLDIVSYTTLHAYCCADRNGKQTDNKDSYTKGGYVNQRSAGSSSSPDPVSPQSSLEGQADQNSTENSLDANNRRDPSEGTSIDRLNEGTSVDFEPPATVLTSQSQQRSSGYKRFFVYCKICDGVRPAKLRLVCDGCGNGAFLVDRGPANWDDISATTSITGRCTSPQCACITPRFFLRCAEPHSGDLDGTAVALKHVNTNRHRVECVVCGDIVSHILIFPCAAGHVTCFSCFRQYCSVSLDQRSFTEHEKHGYTLPCPAGCPDSHIEETHHFLLMGKDQYERYKNFGAEEFVLQNGGMLCPAPGCGMGLFPELETRLVKCEECQFESCRDCRREFHLGPCGIGPALPTPGLPNLGITDEMAERARSDFQSLTLIGETTKSCPQCSTKTERSGGCMHMVCSRCSCEWCWICVKPWTRECMAEHWFG